MTKLRSIPSVNRKPGNLARVARFGKATRTARQDTTSTSFRPQVILPDPKIRAARVALQQAIQQRVAELKMLIEESATPEEADHWRGLLQSLTRGGEK